MYRSYLFAPGHREDLVRKACASEADAVIIDLEDAVPPDAKAAARQTAVAVLQAYYDRTVLVRVNQVRTRACERDLDALVDSARWIRVPKVERPEDLAWVATRLPDVQIAAAIETALGVENVTDIASSRHCSSLSIGGLDLRRDLRLGQGHLPMLLARSLVGVAARAAGLPPPVDSVYPYLDDDEGLESEARHARSLGFLGKAAIHPRQLPIINQVFMPTRDEAAWAEEIVAVFETAGGNPSVTAAGEFVDTPVFRRARGILDLYEAASTLYARSDGTTP